MELLLFASSLYYFLVSACKIDSGSVTDQALSETSRAIIVQNILLERWLTFAKYFKVFTWIIVNYV